MLAQIPIEMWQFGVPSVMCFIMLTALIYSNREIPKSLVEVARSLDRLTKQITHLILAMEFLPDAFHSSAREANQEIEDKRDPKR